MNNTAYAKVTGLQEVLDVMERFHTDNPDATFLFVGDDHETIDHWLQGTALEIAAMIVFVREKLVEHILESRRAA